MLKILLDSGEELSLETFLAMVDSGIMDLDPEEYEALKEMVEFHRLPIEDQLKHFEELGHFYGYPECCIQDFLQRVKDDTKITPEQSEAAQNFGFVPCQKHSEEILRGETTLEQLIKDRKCPYPFPIDLYDVDDDEEDKTANL